jgi:hypothetical protein
MSDGYRGIRVLRLIPPVQHRHATTGPPAGQCMAADACHVACACAGPAAFLIVTNRDHGLAPVRRCGDTPQPASQSQQLRRKPEGERCSRV